MQPTSTTDDEEVIEQTPHRIMAMVQVWVRMDTILDAYPDDPDQAATDAMVELAGQLGVDAETLELIYPKALVVIAVDAEGDGSPAQSVPLADCNACHHPAMPKLLGCNCNCHGLEWGVPE